MGPPLIFLVDHTIDGVGNDISSANDAREDVNGAERLHLGLGVADVSRLVLLIEAWVRIGLKLC